MAVNKETVTWVKHWSDKTFSFKTTRNYPNKFNNGEFAMIGMEHEDKKLMRAYSFASANHEDYLEFLSIKINDGPLTSKLQHLKVGDEILVNPRSTGTLVIDYLEPGRNLYMIATGTGLAPFLGIIKDPATYERFDKVVLTHTVQYEEELAYHDPLKYFNEEWKTLTNGNFIYFNTLTQQEWPRKGRITQWIKDGNLFSSTTGQELDAEKDRFMICGSQGLNRDLIDHFESLNMSEGNTSIPGKFVVEKAFVQR
jgi:ferredoxin--NADP+ reductase|tara:strand:- start:116 stop:877 length:762 start_codon:yes stop_codon:yes gene_type:complete